MLINSAIKKLKKLKRFVKNPDMQKKFLTEDIDQNDFASSVKSIQVKKDNNLTGMEGDASELYYSVVVLD